MNNDDGPESWVPDDDRYVQEMPPADRERTERLAQQLLDIDSSELLARLTEITCQRDEPAVERWPADVEGSNGPLTIFAVDILMSDRGRPVPVVRDELIVPHDAEQYDDARDLALRLGFVADGSPCEGLVRFRPAPGKRADLRAALRELRRAKLPGSPHYVAALRAPVKSLDGPEYTDVVPDREHRDPENGRGAFVIIVDTGIDPFASDRGDDWLRDLDDSDVDPLDVFDERAGVLRPDGYLDGAAGHGTFVAGIVRQIAPGATVRVLRALDPRGLGTEDEIARAIRTAGDLFRQTGRPGVLNLSLGLETVDGQPPQLIERALRTLPEDVLVVAAAGNEPVDVPIWPAWFDGARVIGVAAMSWDRDMRLVPAEWSNSGDMVDFSAVGDGVSSTYVTGREHPTLDKKPEEFPRLGRDGADPVQTDSYARWSGTSFSAPKVAAMLAKLLVEFGDPASALTAMRANRDQLEGFGYIVRC